MNEEEIQRQKRIYESYYGGQVIYYNWIYSNYPEENMASKTINYF